MRSPGKDLPAAACSRMAESEDQLTLDLLSTTQGRQGPLLPSPRCPTWVGETRRGAGRCAATRSRGTPSGGCFSRHEFCVQESAIEDAIETSREVNYKKVVVVTVKRNAKAPEMEEGIARLLRPPGHRRCKRGSSYRLVARR